MRVSFLSVVAGLALLAMGYQAGSSAVQKTATATELRLNLDGAYRDGLYLGRLDRRRGLPLHPARARWSREADRRLFLKGYHRGYDGSLE